MLPLRQWMTFDGGGGLSSLEPEAPKPPEIVGVWVST